MTSPATQGWPARNVDVAWRVIEGQAVLVHSRRGEVHVLNGPGTLVWEAFDRGPDEIARLMSERYGIDATRAEADVASFCAALRGIGALDVPVEPARPAAS